MRHLHLVVTDRTPHANVPILTGRTLRPETLQPPFVSDEAIATFTENCRRAGILDDDGMIKKPDATDPQKG